MAGRRRVNPLCDAAVLRERVDPTRCGPREIDHLGEVMTEPSQTCFEETSNASALARVLGDFA